MVSESIPLDGRERPRVDGRGREEKDFPRQDGAIEGLTKCRKAMGPLALTHPSTHPDELCLKTTRKHKSCIHSMQEHNSVQRVPSASNWRSQRTSLTIISYPYLKEPGNTFSIALAPPGIWSNCGRCAPDSVPETRTLPGTRGLAAKSPNRNQDCQSPDASPLVST